MAETWTIGKLLTWATGYLEGYGVESPRLSAELMLAEVLGLGRLDIYLRFDKPLVRQELADFKALLIRRREHEPVAYLIGRREFYGLDLTVGPGVLVPRPETEMLVEEGLRLIAGLPRPRVLDLCTGSGAVALAIASERPDAAVCAVDMEPAALTYARRNVEKFAFGQRVELLLGDLYAPLAAGGGFFDLITANPPYVSEAEWPQLPRQVRDYEPRSALAGGPAGQDLLGPILKGARAFLRPLGWVLVELGAGQGPAATRLARGEGIYQEIAVLPDLAGLDRVLACQRGDYG